MLTDHSFLHKDLSIFPLSSSKACLFPIDSNSLFKHGDFEEKKESKKKLHGRRQTGKIYVKLFFAHHHLLSCVLKTLIFPILQHKHHKAILVFLTSPYPLCTFQQLPSSKLPFFCISIFIVPHSGLSENCHFAALKKFENAFLTL